MGHVRLGTLPTSRKWRQVVDLIAAGASVEEVAQAANAAADRALQRASLDPLFQEATRLMVELPLAARGPDLADTLEDLGIDAECLRSLPGLGTAVASALDAHARATGERSDLGEMAQFALIESLTAAIEPQIPSLFGAEPGDVRAALGKLAGGERFARLARDYFARLTQRALDYYLSRELANHTGPGRRFAGDSERVAFDAALVTHTYETARIVEDYAGGWYGETIWRGEGPTPEGIAKFSNFAFRKIRNELGRRAAA